MKSKKIFTFALSLILCTALLAGCGDTENGAAAGQTPNPGTTAGHTESIKTAADTTSAADDTADNGAETDSVQPSDPFAGLTCYETEAGLSIYMEDGFIEKETEGVVCYFQKDTCGMTCQKDDFQALEDYEYDTEAMTAADYAGLIMEAYEAGDELLTDEYGSPYIYYEQNIMGIPMAYYGFYHKGSDAFWGTTFICPVEDAETFAPDFHLWASSVELP